MSPFAVILRLLVMSLVVGTVLFGSAGRFAIPSFWFYLLLFAIAMPTTALVAGSDLMRERFHPAPGGKDQLIRILAAPIMLAHFAIAGLDRGRFHWSDTVPLWLQIAAFLALAGCMAVWAIAMHENRFFSSVIRIQRERGHYVVDTGPYRFVRHPGYGGVLTLPLWSGIALGSWWSLAPAVFMTLLFLRRTHLEDQILQGQLEGYPEYAARVRYRLMPGVW